MARKPRSSSEMIAIASMTLEPKAVAEKFGMTEDRIRDAIKAYHAEIDAAFELDKQKRKELFLFFDGIKEGLKTWSERWAQRPVITDIPETGDYCTLKDGSNEPVKKMGDKSYIIQHLS